jgi:hypothetical protein
LAAPTQIAVQKQRIIKMIVSDTVLDIVRLLSEEGFGELAGDVLSRITTGRIIDASSSEGVPRPDTGREPISDHEQLTEVMRLLQSRLVEPARALARAEQIAGSLADRTEGVRVRFIEVEEPIVSGADERSSRPAVVGAFEGPLGDQSKIDELDSVLRRIGQFSSDGPT